MTKKVGRKIAAGEPQGRTDCKRPQALRKPIQVKKCPPQWTGSVVHRAFKRLDPSQTLVESLTRLVACASSLDLALLRQGPAFYTVAVALYSN